MFEKKMQPPSYTYVHTSYPFDFYLLDTPTCCSLCKLTGRGESKHSYDMCPKCLEEMREYKKNQALQDFLFDDIPEDRRVYDMIAHGKVRVTELAVASGALTKDQGYSILYDLGRNLQYPYRAAQAQKQPPSEAAKRKAEFRLF